nr:component of SufBCD complex [Pararhodobacter sp. SW119]
MYDSVLTLIDLRSFSNLWYWIVLAVTWSIASHYVLGVPFDMVLRARRQGGAAMADLEAMVDLQLRRRSGIVRSGGAWLVGLWAAVLTIVALLGFWYRVEIAQALALLAVPLTLVMALSFRLSTRLRTERPRDEALARRLTWHRLLIQIIGVLSILVTALWGMWHNLSMNVLGA